MDKDVSNCSEGLGWPYPLLYGLSKVHKPGTPLCPVFFVNSPTYQLSKFLVSVMSPLVGTSESHVRNSVDFASFITAQTLEPEAILVSFDVVSLFTNVLMEVAISVAKARPHQDASLGDHTCLMVDEIMMLLRFCLNATYFAFGGQYFQQKFGTAMGSPVSVTVANLVMEDVEQHALSTYANPPRYWKRYVPPLPVGKVSSFHQHLNSIEPSIQFTIECEEERKLPFLDMEIVHHSDGAVLSLQGSIGRRQAQASTWISSNCPQTGSSQCTIFAC